MTVRCEGFYMNLGAVEMSWCRNLEVLPTTLRRSDLHRYARFFSKCADDGLAPPDLMVYGDLYGEPADKMRAGDLYDAPPKPEVTP